MNHLAHAVIAGSEDLFMLGQLLGDFATRDCMAGCNPRLIRGVEAHRDLDRFTDGHPAFIRAVRILETGCHRYAPVVMDVFIDHVLARNWGVIETGADYPQFALDLYQRITDHQSFLPDRLRHPALRMCQYKTLSGYATQSGLALILDRLSGRVRIPQWIQGSLPIICAEFQSLEEAALELLADAGVKRYNCHGF